MKSLIVSTLLISSSVFGQQMVIVTNATPSSIKGELHRFEKDTTLKWREVGESFQVVLGRNGLAAIEEKREGDGKSPSGKFSLGDIFGYEMPKKEYNFSFLRSTPTTYCVDDPQSIYYTQIVDTQLIKPDWKSAEEMKRKDSLYKLGMIINYNSRPVISGRGSCIFFHIWKNSKSGTAGCTAMTEKDLQSLLTWLDPKQKPELVQLTKADYDRLKTQWDLPVIK